MFHVKHDHASSPFASVALRSSAGPFAGTRVSRLVWLVAIGFVALTLLACGAANQSRGWAAPVQTDEMVLVSTGKGRLDAIDPVTRDPLWRFPNRWNIVDDKARGLDGIYASPVFSADGKTIFLGDYNGYV
jgi:outer membrane protein assembly factor BamB